MVPGHTVGVVQHLNQRLAAFTAGRARIADQPAGRPVRDGGRPLHLLRDAAADQFWADVCRHIDRDELADDPRFATAEAIAENTEAAVEILTRRSPAALAEWSERFATLVGPWAPVQDTLQVADDAQIRANDYLVHARVELELVANPVQFDVALPRPDPRPDLAEHTDEILLELGLDWDRIIALKTDGAVT